MSSVEVGIRVRPFNSRETKLQCNLIVAMPNSSTCEIGGGVHGAPRKFNVDHCFWTFKDDTATTSFPLEFANQEKVYSAMGKRILENALDGFNACLFAYGQTGSGKTYTMMGTPSDPGVIPRLSAELFEREALAKGGAWSSFTLDVELSYLEIYNEAVRDLLNPKGIEKALRVRQHPTLGVYVENLTKWRVRTADEILKLLEDGGSVRSVAATKMNATSSRSHAILTLSIRKKSIATEVGSLLHLVDLAGSERASSTGAEGDTLTEGANINKSLTTLGMCLSRLAEASSGGKQNQHIPYRDSQLTWLLNDSLGGNSKTAMLANISPASINMEETVSTLRFATTVKKIKNNATVNEDPQQKLIRELRAEIEAIKEKIRLLDCGTSLPEAATREEVQQYSGALDLQQGAAGEVTSSCDTQQNALEEQPVRVESSANPTTGDVGVGALARSVDVEDVVIVAPTEELNEGENRQRAVVLDIVAGVAPPVDESDTPTPNQLVPGVTCPVDDDAALVEHSERAQLLARLEEDTSLFLHALETEEERHEREEAHLEQHRKDMNTFNEEELLLLQVTVKLNLPRLVTLNEDLHRLPPLALLYYLKEGTTEVGGEGIAAPLSIELPQHAVQYPSTEVMVPCMCTLEASGLRQAVTLRVPHYDALPNAEPGVKAMKITRVWVNGHPVDEGEERVLHNGDRLVIGCVAFRYSEPIQWVEEQSGGVGCHRHCDLLEAVRRQEVVVQWLAAIGPLALSVSGCLPEALEVEQSVAFHRLAECEAELEHNFPSSALKESLCRDSVSASQFGGCDHDYQFAVSEINAYIAKQRREVIDQNEAKLMSLQMEKANRDEEIASLRKALWIKETDDKHIAERRDLSQLERKHRLQLVDDAYDAVKHIAELWRDDRIRVNTQLEYKDSLYRDERQQRSEAELDEQLGRDNIVSQFNEAHNAITARTSQQVTASQEASPLTNEPAVVANATSEPSSVAANPSRDVPRSTAANRRLSMRSAQPNRTVDTMLQLAADVRRYEDECREAKLWKPAGPSKPEDIPEYKFSHTSPTIGDVRYYSGSNGNASAGVLHEQNVHKLKRGFLGRLSFHVVHVVVRRTFLYYFSGEDVTSRALGACYLLGADVQTSSKGAIDGRKFTLRIIPSVPRKESKSNKVSTEENNLLFAFDSEDEMNVLFYVVQKLTSPECPSNVRQYYLQQRCGGSESQFVPPPE